MDLLSLGLALAALGISLYSGILLYMLLNRIRSQSSKSFEVASRLQEQWRKFSTRDGEERERLVDRFDRLESATRDRVERFEKVATGARERLIKLEQYLKEFFELELKAVFESFDKTVSSILEEMKAELLRGVDRIEEIQAVVDSKSFAQDRILEADGSVYRLLADTAEGEPTPEPSEAPSKPDEGSVADQGNEQPTRTEGGEEE